jgi:ribosomal RNA assembly protein
MQILKIKTAKKIEAKKDFLEKKLHVKIEVSGVKVEIIEGSEYNRFIAEKIFEALDKNFSFDDSFLLLNEDYVFESIPIKDYTKKKDLTCVRGRVLGKNGRTIEIIGELSECFLTLNENTVNIIGPAGKIKDATNAAISLIQGAKAAKVYAYLERARKHEFADDLGLKIKPKSEEDK